jgi:hypothetical protein
MTPVAMEKPFPYLKWEFIKCWHTGAKWYHSDDINQFRTTGQAARY